VKKPFLLSKKVHSGGIAIRLNELAALKIMHQKIAPNTFSMEHYSKVFNVLTLGDCTIHEISQFAELNEKTVEYLIQNLAQNHIVNRNDHIVHLNCSPQWLLSQLQKNGGHR